MKEQYPPQGKAASRGVGNGNVSAPPPAVPCYHPPGSEGRIATLAGRAERGEQLFHPADYTGAK